MLCSRGCLTLRRNGGFCRWIFLRNWTLTASWLTGPQYLSHNFTRSVNFTDSRNFSSWVSKQQFTLLENSTQVQYLLHLSFQYNGRSLNSHYCSEWAKLLNRAYYVILYQQQTTWLTTACSMWFGHIHLCEGTVDRGGSRQSMWNNKGQ